MKTKVEIFEKIKDLRVENRLHLEDLEKEVGISKSALGSYETNEYKDIPHTSIIKLAQYYGVSTDYLLGLTESREQATTDTSQLGLDDATIEILKSKKINNRLLCEIIKDDSFVQFMTDLEIYVDNIASMQIRNLNAYVAQMRESIIRDYNASENDNYLEALAASVIDEDAYFANIIDNDINHIAKNIRNKHKKDSDTGEDNNPTKDILDMIEEYKKAPDSTQGQLAVYGKLLKINFNKMDAYELKTFTDILNKYSGLMKKGRTGRGKKKS